MGPGNGGTLGVCLPVCQGRGGQAQAEPEEARKAARAEGRRGGGPQAGLMGSRAEEDGRQGGSPQQRDTVTSALRDKCFSMHKAAFRRMFLQELNIGHLGRDQ